MFYAHSRSRCVHARATCRRSRVDGARPVEFDRRTMRLCRHCFAPTRCFACLDETCDAVRAPCAEHALCVGCVDLCVASLSARRGWDGEVRCPCGEALPRAALPRSAREAIDAYLRDAAERRDGERGLEGCRPFHYDVLVDKVLTLRCPHCDAAFFDFDGCLALRCACGGHFCGKCLAACTGPDDAHAHALRCNDDYFMSRADWDVHVHNAKCRAIWAFLAGVVRETRSVAYALCLALMLTRNHGRCTLPHALGRGSDGWLATAALLLALFVAFHPIASLLASGAAALLAKHACLRAKA